MLEFKNISVTLGGRSVLNGVSFPLQPHRITALLGRNGCGKSTLISCVTGLVPYSGEVRYQDCALALMPPRERAKLVAALPQSLPRAALTVRELAAMGRNPYLDLGRRLSEEDRRQIQRAMECVEIAELSDRTVAELSGGERQRAYLAMILAQNTRIILLDEPTTYMDMEHEAKFLGIVQKLKAERRKTILIVMHDLTRAVEMADNIAVLDGGRAAFFGPAEDCVQSGVLERVFGVKRSAYQKDGAVRPLYYA